MNDNLRYISLQYIKGENYEKITCFNSDDIAKIQKILKEPSYIEEHYKLLEAILKVEKREIGESLLDDLINYISLQSLKEPIKEGIENKKGLLKNFKKDAIDANKDSSKKRKKLNELIKKVSDDINNEEIEEYKTILDDIFAELNKIYKIEEEVKGEVKGEVKNYINEQDIKKYLDLLEVLLKNKDDSPTDIDEQIKKRINLLTYNIKNKIENSIDMTKEDLILLANFVINFLKMLVKFETQNNDDEKKENKSSIDNLEKLIKIFKKYLYICENNIKKYEKIFDHNEIGNIDEAFMIESYSKFLKKLYKLKQNLESKDTEKIKRELINSLDQFFNLHGFNNPEKIVSKAEIDYIVQRILNYT